LVGKHTKRGKGLVRAWLGLQPRNEWHLGSRIAPRARPRERGLGPGAAPHSGGRLFARQRTSLARQPSRGAQNAAAAAAAARAARSVAPTRPVWLRCWGCRRAGAIPGGPRFHPPLRTARRDSSYPKKKQKCRLAASDQRNINRACRVFEMASEQN
jgi:hypothetical protein